MKKLKSIHLERVFVESTEKFNGEEESYLRESRTKIKVEPSKNLGLRTLKFSYSPTKKQLELAVLKMAKSMGANAYEICGTHTMDWVVAYLHPVSFYKIDEQIFWRIQSELENRGKQLELDFYKSMAS